MPLAVLSPSRTARHSRARGVRQIARRSRRLESKRARPPSRRRVRLGTITAMAPLLRRTPFNHRHARMAQSLCSAHSTRLSHFASPVQDLSACADLSPTTPVILWTQIVHRTHWSWRETPTLAGPALQVISGIGVANGAGGSFLIARNPPFEAVHTPSRQSRPGSLHRVDVSLLQGRDIG